MKSIVTSVPKRLGTYSFCRECPTSKTCCCRVKPGGHVDQPVLYPKDVTAIEKYIGKEACFFSSALKEGKAKERIMDTGSRGCFFFQRGKCAIYPVRPLDCRLFPFDIMEREDGQLVWIVYTRLCPVGFDPYHELNEAIRLLPELHTNIVSYARINVPGMDKEPYLELGKVQVPQDKLSIISRKQVNNHKEKINNGPVKARRDCKSYSS